MGKPLSDALRIEAEDMLEQMLSPEVVAKELDIAESTVYKIRREMGFVRQKGAWLEAIDVDGVVAAYRRKVPIRKICKEFDLGDTANLYRILSAVSEPVRKYIPEEIATRKRQLDEAMRLYIAGMVINQIVLDTGISQTALHFEIRKRGIPLRRRRMTREALEAHRKRLKTPFGEKAEDDDDND